MIRRMYHTSFTVSDMERSLAFYQDLLGLEVVADQGGKGGYLATVTGFPDVDMRVVFLRTPAARSRSKSAWMSSLTNASWPEPGLQVRTSAGVPFGERYSISSRK